MISHDFIGLPVIRSNTGDMYRPYAIDGKEICKLNLNTVLQNDDNAQKELNILVKSVNDTLGTSFTIEQINDFLRKRKIEYGN